MLNYHVYLTTYSEYIRKADLQKTKVNAMKTQKVYADKNKLGKNGGHGPTSLGGKSIVVVNE